MTKIKTYISCPVSLDSSILSNIIIAADEHPDRHVSWWVRDKNYNPSLLANADDVIIVHPKNHFRFNSSELPVGVRNELAVAVHAGKKIYLAYQSVSFKSWGFYETNVTVSGRNYAVEGVPGSSAKYYEQEETKSSQKDSPWESVKVISDYSDSKEQLNVPIYDDLVYAGGDYPKHLRDGMLTISDREAELCYQSPSGLKMYNRKFLLLIDG